MISPEKATPTLFQAYLDSEPGQSNSGSHAPTKIGESLLVADYELAALYAQIEARVGNSEEALNWLEQSLERGNYDLIQLQHPDFRPLLEDQRFVALRSDLEERIEELAGQLRSELF